MRTRRLRLGVAALAALLLAGIAAAGSAAAGGGGNLALRSVDGTDPANVEVTFLYRGERDDLAGLRLRENGRQVETTSAVPLTDQQSLSVVLLIDVSQSMATRGAIDRAKEAATAYVGGKTDNEEVAIVTFGTEVDVPIDFTSDASRLEAAIGELGVSTTGGTRFYDGLTRAARLLSEDASGQANIIMLSDGDDAGSAETPERAVSEVLNAEAAVFSVGISSDRFNSGPLQSIAEQSDGLYSEANDPSQLVELFGQVQETLSRQYVVSFESSADGPAELLLTVGGSQVEGTFTPGSVAAGRRVQPLPISEPSGPDFLRSEGGLFIALMLVLVGGALLVFTLINTFSRDPSALESALQPYAESYVADTDDDDDPRSKGLAQTQILQRAVELTGQLAERQGILPRIESRLEQANLPLRAAEALFFYLASVVLLTMLALVVSRNWLMGLVALLFVAAIPPLVLSFLANRRRKQFEGMLPDTLQLLSSTLRAGYSLMQGVEAVSQEVSEPMGRELRRVVTEARLGRPLEIAMQGVADRMDSPDFAWAVMAIRIQREVGGNLSELLLTVAETMTQRERLRRDVRALTAEGRISAIILGILPIALALIMYAINPDYIEVLFDKTIGNIMLVGSLILAGVGFYWMKKTIDIDI
jgi:tight adherence protein B